MHTTLGLFISVARNLFMEPEDDTVATEPFTDHLPVLEWDLEALEGIARGVHADA